MKLCDQENCYEVAAYRYTWPGQSEAEVCTAHAKKARQVAESVDLDLEMIPLHTTSQMIGRLFNLFKSSEQQRFCYEMGAAIGEKMQKTRPCRTCGHGEAFHFDRFCAPELLATMEKHVDGSCRMEGCECAVYEASKDKP